MTKIIKRITSNRNEKVKLWRSLRTRKGRRVHGSLLIEGEHLLQEAISAGWTIKALLIEEQKEAFYLPQLPYFPVMPPVYLLPSALFTDLMDTVTPQGIAAEVEIPDNPHPAVEFSTGPLLLLDAIQDPGNLGTILRTAEAAGVQGVYLGQGTVDPFNSKTVRGAMGSLFRLSLYQVELQKVIPQLKEQGVWVVGTAPRTEKLYFHSEYPRRIAFLLGNEGHGVDPQLRGLVNEEVKIPMAGQVESLSVVTAAGILLFEWVRQSHQ